MKVLVLGAGILGTTSAWYLNRLGHEVTVVDRQPGAGLETSFANGSQISVSYAEPWANPGAPLKLLKWLARDDSPLLFRLRLDPHQWRWGLQFFFECAPGRTRFNTIQLTNLALYSRQCLIALRRDTAIEYDALEKGILHLFETEKDYAAARPGLELMREFGCTMNFLNPKEIAALEPSLAQYQSRLVGGAHAPDDETGDAFKFSQRLAALAAGHGVAFRYDTNIVRLIKASGRIDGVLVTQNGREEVLRADAYVVALGSWSAPMLRDIGISLLIYPTKGYSATVPIKAGAVANVVSITDHQMKIVFSRLADRVRIAGTAELSGYDLSLNKLRCEALTTRADEIFPGVLDIGRAEYWAGLRPATPSNLPYIGRSRIDNLWLNTGHGTLGWTHGAGSGQALADLMSNRKPEVDFAFCTP
ncbi:MAG: D-amino acid dehydrogenase [Burkholderiaceae bacterium]|jgi:D-amino-acid dehydrogenase